MQVTLLTSLNCKVKVDTNNVLELTLDRKRYFAFGQIDSNVRQSSETNVVLEINFPDQEVYECKWVECIPVPSTIDPQKAIMLPPLIFALRVWDKLGLELGEAAIYTTGSTLSRLVGQVAVWRGGNPVIQLGKEQQESTMADRVECLAMEDTADALRILSDRIKNKPGIAIVELSGDPEFIDILLESIPKWGRMMCAAHSGNPLTIDFYNNIHRKGVTVQSCGFGEYNLFINNNIEIRDQINQACKILSNEQMFKICKDLICAR